MEKEIQGENQHLLKRNIAILTLKERKKQKLLNQRKNSSDEGR
jgi:hypothetical protein